VLRKIERDALVMNRLISHYLVGLLDCLGWEMGLDFFGAKFKGVF
jgi:hypothetical protein